MTAAHQIRPQSLHMPINHLLARSRVSTRSPSPSSSICSRATSVDDLGDMPRIDLIRPIYHSHSSIDDSPMEWLQEEPVASSSKLVTHDNSPSDEAKESVKGKEKRRFPEEEEEDLLRESNSRFVLFPIKYREVS